MCSCVCACTPGAHVYVPKKTRVESLASLSDTIPTSFETGPLTAWSSRLGWTGLSQTPGSFVSASPALNYRGVPHLTSYPGVLGIKPRSSCVSAVSLLTECSSLQAIALEFYIIRVSLKHTKTWQHFVCKKLMPQLKKATELRNKSIQLIHKSAKTWILKDCLVPILSDDSHI